jgi:hypothetical protein
MRNKTDGRIVARWIEIIERESGPMVDAVTDETDDARRRLSNSH